MILVNYYSFGYEQQGNSVKIANGIIGSFFEDEKVTSKTKKELRHALKKFVLQGLKTTQVSVKNMSLEICYNQIKNGKFYKTKNMRIPFNTILKWKTSC